MKQCSSFKSGKLQKILYAFLLRKFWSAAEAKWHVSKWIDVCVKSLLEFPRFKTATLFFKTPFSWLRWTRLSKNVPNEWNNRFRDMPLCFCCDSKLVKRKSVKSLLEFPRFETATPFQNFIFLTQMNLFLKKKTSWTSSSRVRYIWTRKRCFSSWNRFFFLVEIEKAAVTTYVYLFRKF